ncbi:MAG: hypothetical protein GYB31_05575 [Bacteroidetes bacterium]|nr:hypothetical protein [Bacteroidota bacterium]
MKFQPLRKAKKVQQFRALSRQLQKMARNGSFFNLSQEKQLSLKEKVVRLYREIGAQLPKNRVRKTLAALALVFSLAGSAYAQTFAA